MSILDGQCEVVKPVLAGPRLVGDALPIRSDPVQPCCHLFERVVAGHAGTASFLYHQQVHWNRN